MQRLVDRYGASAIINGYNVGTNMVEMDVAADNDVIMMHANTLISHNEKFKTDPARFYGSFQIDPPEYFYGPGCLSFLNDLIKTGAWKPANRKIAIISSAVEYAIVIANAMKTMAAKYGFEVGLFETVGFPTSQWGPTLAKLRQDPLAAILVTHFLPQDLAQFMLKFVPQPTQSLIYMQYGPSLPAFRQIGPTGSDLATLVEGIRISRRIAGQAPLANILSGELAPNASATPTSVPTSAAIARRSTIPRAVATWERTRWRSSIRVLSRFTG